MHPTVRKNITVKLNLVYRQNYTRYDIARRDIFFVKLQRD